jgi:hypothetical protein
MKTRLAPELHHCGLDWLTVTSSWDADAEAVIERGAALVKAFATSGYKPRETSWQGYKGEIAGPIMWGRRGDGVVLRASGAGARYAFDVVKELKVHPTRIDVQATIDYHERDMQVLAARVKRDAMRARFLREGSEYKVQHIVGCGDGDAVLIGRRSSSAFGRSYDKYRESLQKYKESVSVSRDLGFPDGTWRYEVEYKADKAQQVFERLKPAGDDKALEKLIVGDVKGWYADHGVNVPVDEQVQPVVKDLPHQPDLDRSIAWFASSVAPTLSWVASEGRLGPGIEALGLGKLLRAMSVDDTLDVLGITPFGIKKKVGGSDG